MTEHLVWATDIHLDHLDAGGRRSFAEALVASNPRAVVLTGDLSNAKTLEAHLGELAGVVRAPIYFVLGNHDYYGGNLEEVRAAMDRSYRRDPVHYIHGEVVLLSEDVALVGTDGWGDCRLGDFMNTDIVLNDFIHIQNLILFDRESRIRALRALGDDSAAALERPLEEALFMARRVIVATHVPPFEGSCWYKGSTSYPDWLPYFACAAVGEVLLRAADRFPDREIEVLCGHTHNAGTYQPRPNLIVRTGWAEYGAPAVQALLPLT